MKTNRIVRRLSVLLCLLFMVSVFPMAVSADTGPKPSVHISFAHMGDELCYGTLLSKNSSTGPSSAWDGKEEHAEYDEDFSGTAFNYEIWKAFVEYKDSDGYYFLQKGWVVSETKEIAWTYYPPSSFKILLYFPATETFVVSGIYEAYAFDTYYTVDMDGISDDAGSADGILAYRSYRYGVEIGSLAARILLTIIIEMAVALLFGFRKKKQLLLLIFANTATQILLNVLLNIINYHSGQFAFLFYYFLFEWIVIVLEAVVYCVWMRKLSENPKPLWFYVLYAILANAVSFGAGVLLARWLPGIF